MEITTGSDAMDAMKVRAKDRIDQTIERAKDAIHRS